uniref:phenylalanine--tRNA ligase n=1 Tax=Gelidium vagum TaxID=35171 RepID=A0A141SE93_GELVA|nr:phenylalanyl-tRNA synthetase beta chain [Gelidium vagum]AMK96611.1 phenylalanyl-tRNA synthetase beta chain [Gelidium vagum]
MKFSWKSLNKLVNLTSVQINTLTKKLTLAGFEVEEIMYIDYINDYVINIDITTNRQDVACIIGLAEEISVILDIPLRNHILKTYTKNYNEKNQLHLQKTFSSSESILDIAIQQIENLQAFKSPLWLTNYLIIHEIKPSNTILDIVYYIHKNGARYISLDCKSITQEAFQIELINSIPIDKTNSLQDTDQKLQTELLKYNEHIISTNGHDVNNKYMYQSSSSSIIVYSMILDAIYIKNNIKNKASTKHLKYINRTHFMKAYREAIQLITQFTNGKEQIEYRYHRKQKKQIIHIDKNLIYNILGPLNNHKRTYLPIQNIFNILLKLQFQPQYKNHTFTLTIPTYRSEDIQRPIDIIEEIGRIYGFSQFTDNLPTKSRIGYVNNITKNTHKIRKIFRDIGLSEIKNYSLQKYIDETYISLYNPLIKDQSNLRISLLDNLIQTKQYNIKHGNKNIEGFEIGNVFYQKHNHSFHETTSLAGILGNRNFARQSWSSSEHGLTWFQAKGTMEEFFDRLQTKIEWASIIHIQNDYKINNCYNLNIYNQKNSALLYNIFTKEHIGIFGELKKKLNDKLNSNHKTYIFEINVNALSKAIRKNHHLKYIVKPYSHYPSVTRDVSIKLKSNLNISYIKQSIFKGCSKLIESIDIFNEYIKITDGSKEKYVGIRITYRAQNRTLNDNDIINIDNQINNIINLYI